jgi:gliding motility-associated-like protein
MRLLQEKSFTKTKKTMHTFLKKIQFPVLTIVIFCCLNIKTQAQIGFQLGNEFTNGAGYGCVPIMVENFDSILAFQFSINWNPADLEFVEISDINLPNMDEDSFGENLISEGKISVAWDMLSSSGLTRPNGTVIFSICFNATGMPEDIFPVNFAEMPTPSLVTYWENMNVKDTMPSLINGSLTVGSPLAITNSTITNVPCFGTLTASINVEVAGGTPPYSFNWNPSQPDTNIIENISAGTYNLTITDDFGETITTIFEVTQPGSSVSIDEIILPNLTCEILSGTIEIIAAGGTSPYTYQFNGTENTTGIFENISAGDYSLTIVDDNQCELENMIQVPLPISPNAFLTGDTLSCDEPITITTNNGNFSYDWFFNGNPLNLNQNVIEVTQSGTYQIELTNDDACKDTASIDIVFAPPIEAIINVNAYEICPDETVTLTPEGGEMYSWVGQNLTIDASQTATFSSDQSGLFIFDLAATDEYNCKTDTTSVEILVLEPSGFVSQDTCIAINGTVELMAFNGISYEWEDNVFPVSDSEISNPTSTPTTNTTYTVAIIDENGCFITDSIRVEVIDNPLDFVTAINVITPNGDGENDFLAFENLEKFPRNRLIVFNRWGGEVYSSLSYENDWGGTYNGNKLPTGDYYYVLSVGDKQLKSSLTILNDE